MHCNSVSILFQHFRLRRVSESAQRVEFPARTQRQARKRSELRPVRDFQYLVSTVNVSIYSNISIARKKVLRAPTWASYASPVAHQDPP